MTRIGSVIKILNNGGIGVLLTDTIYGIVGKAFSKKTVDKIYEVKDRNSKKPFIILFSKINDLKKFGVRIDEELFENYWPGPVSIILPIIDKEKLNKIKYLHRGTKSLAFRMIGKKNKNLFSIIENTGPLVAPSANKEGEMPARNITEAKKYFGNKMGFYLNSGTKTGKASKIISLDKKGNVTIIRK